MVRCCCATSSALGDPHGVLIDVSMHDVARDAFDLAPMPAPPDDALDVRTPRARRPTDQAPRLGEHTAEVMTL